MLTKGTGFGEMLYPVCGGITSSGPLRDLDLSPAQVVMPLPPLNVTSQNHSEADTKRFFKQLVLFYFCCKSNRSY